MKAYLDQCYGTYVVTLDDGRNILVQQDCDFVSLARVLGFNLRRRGERCPHRHTDGTVDCPECRKTTTSFLLEALDFLDARIGRRLRLSRHVAETLDEMAGDGLDQMAGNGREEDDGY